MAATRDSETRDQETAWSRFERAVDAAVKGGPKHKVAPTAGVDKKTRPASKGRVHKGKSKN
ncbi:hypothetical protein LMG27198_16110 [Methylocystis echinoides]|uniref:Uncharacterized protein n=1 Tax=Methylocystis echinoides TaxID=29468 RepID=A0A9W6LRT0_9HYPH|nr:hypothetical protein LMG27198_16110 [Methylocystis echinoides]